MSPAEAVRALSTFEKVIAGLLSAILLSSGITAVRAWGLPGEFEQLRETTRREVGYLREEVREIRKMMVDHLESHNGGEGR